MESLGKYFLLFTGGESDQQLEHKEKAFKEMIKWMVWNEQEQMAFTQEVWRNSDMKLLNYWLCCAKYCLNQSQYYSNERQQMRNQLLKETQKHLEKHRLHHRLVKLVKKNIWIEIKWSLALNIWEIFGGFNRFICDKSSWCMCLSKRTSSKVHSPTAFKESKLSWGTWDASCELACSWERWQAFMTKGKWQ